MARARPSLVLPPVLTLVAPIVIGAFILACPPVAGARDLPRSAPLTEGENWPAPSPTVPPATVPATGNGGFVELKINQDQTTEVQNEEQIVVNPLDPNNLVAVWRDFRFGYRQVGYAYSFDGGASWTEDIFVEPQYDFDSDPGLTVDRFGNFYAVILSYDTTSQPNGLFVLKSTDGGVTWGPPVPAVNNTPGVFEDKELIACDRNADTPTSGNLYVAWARFFSADIMCVRSTDGGQSFETPVSVSDQSSNQWPVPVVGRLGEVYVAWVSYQQSAIKLDVSIDGGATFGVDRTITSVLTPQTDINGGISVFSFPAMDSDISNSSPFVGNLYVAYMDWGGADFDLFFRRSTDFGNTWSAPVRVNDDPEDNGRDQFHPWITIEPDGTIHAVWLDRRDDPGNYRYHCYVSKSTDAGATWQVNRRVSSVPSDPQAGQIEAGLLGEYIGVAAANGRVTPLWTDTRLGNQDAWVAYEPSTGLAAIEAPPAGGSTLGWPHPNPFNPFTRIPVRFDAAGRAELRIHDASGRLVRVLGASANGAGSEVVTWDGRDSAGVPVASGVYYVGLRQSESGTRRLVLVR